MTYFGCDPKCFVLCRQVFGSHIGLLTLIHFISSFFFIGLMSDLCYGVCDLRKHWLVSHYVACWEITGWPVSAMCSDLYWTQCNTAPPRSPGFSVKLKRAISCILCFVTTLTRSYKWSVVYLEQVWALCWFQLSVSCCYMMVSACMTKCDPPETFYAFFQCIVMKALTCTWLVPAFLRTEKKRNIIVFGHLEYLS